MEKINFKEQIPDNIINSNFNSSYKNEEDINFEEYEEIEDEEDNPTEDIKQNVSHHRSLIETTSRTHHHLAKLFCAGEMPNFFHDIHLRKRKVKALKNDVKNVNNDDPIISKQTEREIKITCKKLLNIYLETINTVNSPRGQIEKNITPKTRLEPKDPITIQNLNIFIKAKQINQNKFTITALVELSDYRIAFAAKTQIYIWGINYTNRKWEKQISKSDVCRSIIQSICELRNQRLIVSSLDPYMSVLWFNDKQLNTLAIINAHQDSINKVIPLNLNRFASCSSDKKCLYGKVNVLFKRFYPIFMMDQFIH